MNSVSDINLIVKNIYGYLPNVFMAMILVVCFWIAEKVVSKMLSTSLQRLKVDNQIVNLILKSVKVGIYIFGFLTIADQLKINVTSLIAGVGVMGLAVSFAAQDTVGNIISGIVLIIDKPFRVGDWILMGNLHALVTDIGLRTTVVTSFDNETVVIPNKQIAQERIINFTIHPRIRVKVPFGVAYKEDIDQVRKICLDMVRDDKRILELPEPIVIVSNLGDSSVNMQLRFWIQNSIDQFPMMWEYTEKVKKALDKAGIQIPFPHLQMFLEDTSAVAKLANMPKKDNES